MGLVTDDDWPPEILRGICEKIWPDSTTARMSRVFDVSQRTVQKWLSGQLQVPADVINYLNAELTALETPWADGQPSLDQMLGDAVSTFSKAPFKLHEETIAAHVALLYKRLMHREIE